MSKGTLLLADDSITIQKVVNLTFADEGIDVVAVGDGDTAAARLAEVKPDIVLADVNMPGLTGYQICEMIRQNEATKDLPVVLLVGSFEPFDEAEANRVGASSYMTKPFQSIRQLVSQVTDLMEAKGGEPKVEIPFAEPETSASLEQTPEATDIESLYQSSFGTEREPESEPAAAPSETPRAEYVDAGMDDEMILTSYLDDARVEGVREIREEPESIALETADNAAQTQPEESKIDQDTIPSFAGESTAAAVAFDQFSETVPIENEEVLAIGEQPVSNGESTSDSGDVFDVPEAPAHVPDQTVEMPAAAAASASTARSDFDEVDLLEIPGVDSGKTLEFTTEQAAAAAGNKTEVVSLSPELMEIIVQKVVEKLSEKY